MDIFLNPPPIEYELPTLKYDIAYHFNGQVEIDTFSDLKLRPDPVADKGSDYIQWKDVVYFGDVKLDKSIRRVKVDTPVFAIGNPTNSMNQQESNKWMVIPALVGVMNTEKREVVNTPMWLFVNSGKSTEDFVHFPDERPVLAPGYIENGNVVHSRVSVAQPTSSSSYSSR
jgi:hypothetical protein